MAIVLPTLLLFGSPFLVCQAAATAPEISFDFADTTLQRDLALGSEFLVYVHLGDIVPPKAVSCRLKWVASRNMRLIVTSTTGATSNNVGWFEREDSTVTGHVVVSGTIEHLVEAIDGKVHFYYPLLFESEDSTASVRIWCDSTVVTDSMDVAVGYSATNAIFLNDSSVVSEPFEIESASIDSLDEAGATYPVAFTGSGLYGVTDLRLEAGAESYSVEQELSLIAEDTLWMMLEIPPIAPGTYTLVATRATGETVSGPEMTVVALTQCPAPDTDCNSINDADELLLAKKFCPTVVINANDTSGKMRPCPVGIMGRRGSGPWDLNRLTANTFWAEIWHHHTFTFMGTHLLDSPSVFDPLPSFGQATFNYSNLQRETKYLYYGKVNGTGPTYFYVNPHPDYGGPGNECPEQWEDIFHTDYPHHPRGDTVRPTTYCHLFLDWDGKPVIQYWFFYPYNDFVNQHEGDWEHLNVKLTSANPSTAAIDSLAYYFHEAFTPRASTDPIVHFDAPGTHPIVWVGGYGNNECALCNNNNCGGSDGYASHGSYPSWGNWVNVSELEGALGLRAPCDDNPQDEFINRCGVFYNWKEFDIQIMQDPSTINFAADPGRSWIKSGMGWGSTDVPTYCDNINEPANQPPISPYRQATWSAFRGTVGQPNHNAYLGNPYGGFGGHVLNAPSQAFASVRAALLCTIPRDTVLVGNGNHQIYQVTLPNDVTVLSSGGAAACTLTFGDEHLFANNAAIRTKNSGIGLQVGDVGHGFTFRTPYIDRKFAAVRLAPSGRSVVRDNIFDASNISLPRYFVGIEAPAGDSLQFGSADRILERNLFKENGIGVKYGLGALATIGKVSGSTFVDCDTGITWSGAGPDSLAIGDKPSEPGAGTANDFLGSGKGVVTVGTGIGAIGARANFWDTIEPSGIAAKVSSGIPVTPWWDEGHANLFYEDPVDVDEPEGRGREFRLLTAGPTPTRGEFSIQAYSPGAGRVTTRVVDASGRQVLEGSSEGVVRGHWSVRLNLSGVAAGTYFVHVSSEYGEARTRIVVVR